MALIGARRTCIWSEWRDRGNAGSLEAARRLRACPRRARGRNRSTGSRSLGTAREGTGKMRVLRREVGRPARGKNRSTAIPALGTRQLTGVTLRARAPRGSVKSSMEEAGPWMRRGASVS